MSKILDSDLLLVQRGTTSYKATGADLFGSITSGSSTLLATIDATGASEVYVDGISTAYDNYRIEATNIYLNTPNTGGARVIIQFTSGGVVQPTAGFNCWGSSVGPSIRNEPGGSVMNATPAPNYTSSWGMNKEPNPGESYMQIKAGGEWAFITSSLEKVDKPMASRSNFSLNLVSPGSPIGNHLFTYECIATVTFEPNEARINHLRGAGQHFGNTNDVHNTTGPGIDGVKFYLMENTKVVYPFAGGKFKLYGLS